MGRGIICDDYGDNNYDCQYGKPEIIYNSLIARYFVVLRVLVRFTSSLFRRVFYELILYLSNGEEAIWKKINTLVFGLILRRTEN